MSDFYEQPEQIVKVVEPLRYRGNEVVLFHVLDPKEIAPKFRDPVLLQDVEDETAMEVSPGLRAQRIQSEDRRAHAAAVATKPRAAGLDYCFHEYRQAARRGLAELSGDSPEEDVVGFPRAMVSRRPRRFWACRSTFICFGNTARSPCRSAR